MKNSSIPIFRPKRFGASEPEIAEAATDLSNLLVEPRELLLEAAKAKSLSEAGGSGDNILPLTAEPEDDPNP